MEKGKEKPHEGGASRAVAGEERGGLLVFCRGLWYKGGRKEAMSHDHTPAGAPAD